MKFKRLILSLSIVLTLVFCFVLSVNAFVAGQYDVEAVYEGTQLKNGSLALTRMGNLEAIETVLTPMTLDVGTYEIEVAKKAKDLYKVQGKEIYIKTKYCYEYAYSEKVILKITSSSGYSIGEIIF